VLKAQINKTDRGDARGMAQMMRAGLYRPVHVKTLRSQKLRMLLNSPHIHDTHLPVEKPSTASEADIAPSREFAYAKTRDGRWKL
jgi:hypothetical protein